MNPTIIPIKNPAFEQAAGWRFVPSSGIMQYNGAPAAFAGYGGSFSQDLGITPQMIQAVPNAPHGYYTDGVYVLKFSVANFFPSYPGYYTAEIDFGTQELGECSGWGAKQFTEITLVCPGPGYIVAAKSLPGGGPLQGADNLVVRFTVNDGSLNGGWQLLFKDVSLMFTPEAP